MRHINRLAVRGSRPPGVSSDLFAIKLGFILGALSIALVGLALVLT